MMEYEVRVTPQASDQLYEYAQYIQDELLNPQAARKLVEDIRKAIKELGKLPHRHSLTEEEPWRGMGVRKAVVRGYLVYFWIDEGNSIVHVVAIVYERRDQANQLSQVDFDW